ncbi:MAG: TVP38/TMEM64 family protein [Oligoflexales bacterium]
MKSKMFFTLLLLSVLGLIIYFDVATYLNLETLRERQGQLKIWVQEEFWLSCAAFLFAYIVMAAFSVPGATILTLAGGAVFGLFVGTVLVSLGSTVGATCSMLIARYLLRDAVASKLHDRIESLNKGFEKEGAFYLFSLRLIPIFPFFVVNLMMGILPISIASFFFVSQLGMLPATLVYVNAGTELSKLQSLSDVASPGLLMSFALLGALPILSKKFLDFLKNRR